MENITRNVKSYANHLQVGFSLCKDASRENISSAFSLMEHLAQYIADEDISVVDTLLLFIDFYPFLSLCGCSSIASANLYPEDAERKAIGSYEVFQRVSLTNHILNGIIQLNRLFSNVSTTGTVYLKVHSIRIELKAVDYFSLLIAYLYHDVGKSPHILSSLNMLSSDYRKMDHAFASGALLSFLRRELSEHNIHVSDSVFERIYLPVVNHHQKTTDKLSIVLKYIDQKAREYELQRAGIEARLGGMEYIENLKQDNQYDTTPEEVKRELDTFPPIPDALWRAFLYGVMHKLIPQRRRLQGKEYHTYIHFPPSIYIASHHVKALLLHITKKAGVVLHTLESMEEMDIARLLIRKARDEGHVKDPLFQKDLLAGWWYKVRTRDGKTLYFFGFPIHVGELTKTDARIVDIKPLSKEELEKFKNKKNNK